MKQTNDFGRRVTELIEASIATKQFLLRSQDVISTIAKVSELVVDALKQGNKALLVGNGGRAADEQHIAAALVGRFAFDRPALPALALSVNSWCVTAGMTTDSIECSLGNWKLWLVLGTSQSAFRRAGIHRAYHLRIRGARNLS